MELSFNSNLIKCQLSVIFCRYAEKSFRYFDNVGCMG